MEQCYRDIRALGTCFWALASPHFSGVGCGEPGCLAEVLAAGDLWEGKVLGRMLLPLEFCAGVALPALVQFILLRNLCLSSHVFSSSAFFFCVFLHKSEIYGF